MYIFFPVDPQTTPMWLILLLYTFCRWGNWGTLKLSNLQTFSENGTAGYIYRACACDHLVILSQGAAGLPSRLCAWFGGSDTGGWRLYSPGLISGQCCCQYLNLSPDEIIPTGTRATESKVNKSSAHAQELSRLNVKGAKADLKWLKWQEVKCEWSEWITKACMNSIAQVQQIQYQFNFWPRAEGKQGQRSRRVKGNEQLYYFFSLCSCIWVCASIY